ncbi:MAG: hypothetical protein KAJ12_14915, partial [Bacteroidetes bacterium]|nr:hypothetical protein [Bacteroidota bacterium]
MRATGHAFLAPIILVSLVHTLAYSQTDSIRVYWLSPIEVTAQRMYIGQRICSTTKDNLSTLF